MKYIPEININFIFWVKKYQILKFNKRNINLNTNLFNLCFSNNLLDYWDHEYHLMLERRYINFTKTMAGSLYSLFDFDF